MKTRKKLLIALLSATCLTAGAFGMAACGGSSEPQPDPTLYAIYNKYVADNPDSAKTYEEWLKDKFEAVAQPGKPGENGKNAYELYIASLPADAVVPTEAEWLASLIGQAGAAGVTPHIGENGNWYLGETDTGVKAEGKDGVSVENVTMSADGKKLLITLSGVDTPVEVTLPDSMTHVHTQGTEYKTIVAPTPESEGLGYTECTAGDGHIELVVIPTYSYKFNVSLPGQNNLIPFEGATVTLKDGEEVVATGKTDANGDAYFNNVEKKVYTYEITAEGYNVIYDGEEIYAEPKTDEYNSDYAAILIKAAESGDGSEDSPYVITPELNKKEDVAYAYFVPAKETRHGYELNTDVYFTFTAPKSGVYGLMEFNNLQFDSTKNTYQDGALFLSEGEQAVVSLKSFDTIYDFSIVLIVFAEELKPGTQVLPMNFEADKEFTITSDDADEDGYVYLKFTSKKSSYKFTSSIEGVEISYVDDNYMDCVVDFSKSVNNIGVGEFSWESVTAFKVMLPDGADSVTMKVELAPGADADHAIELTHNTAGKPGFYDNMYQNYSAWYKYVVTAENAGLKTLEFAEGGSFELYSEDAHGEDDNALVHADGSYPFMFEEGTYYIKATVAAIWDDDYVEHEPDSFKIRDYNEATDKGLSKYAYLTVTLGTATDVSYRYYKYTAAEAGLYIVEGNCYVYSDAEFKTEIAVKDGMIELAANQSAYFEMNIDYSNYPNFNSLTLTKVTDEMLTTPVKYTIIVKDYNNADVAGVTVTVNGVSGTTDEYGIVELSTVPGEYEVELDFGDNADTYYYGDKVTTEKLLTDSETIVIVDVMREVSVAVTDYDTMMGIEGIEVTVWTQVQGDRGDEAEEPVWEQVGEAKTTSGMMGAATFTLLSGKKYMYKLANVPEQYKVAESYSSNQIELHKKSEEPENPDNPDNPDDPKPEVQETYLYKGWKDEIEGEKSYKLFTGNSREEEISSIRVTVYGGYIKNLKALNAQYWDPEDPDPSAMANAVIDGQLQEDNSMFGPAWYGSDENGYAHEVTFDAYNYTLQGGDGIKLELEVCSFGDAPVQVIIEKVSTKANNNF